MPNAIHYSFPPGKTKPMLWIRARNPKNKRASPLEALAIVDTGSDACIFPATCAAQFSLKLFRGNYQSVKTAKGKADSYIHNVQIDILGMNNTGLSTNKVLYTIDDIPVRFIAGGKRFLLGAEAFLSDFILVVNYPRHCFSLDSP